MLKAIIKRLLYKLTLAKWRINTKKSVLTPSHEVEFLGAKWDGAGVTRTEEATKAVYEVLAYVYNNDIELESKMHQRIRGFLNYYMGFAGNVHVITNTILKMSSITKRQHFHYMLALAKTNTIRFKKKKANGQKFTLYTDATEDQLGALIVNRSSGERREIIAPAETSSILYNEAHAAMLPFIRDDNKELENANITLHVDNKAVIGLFKRGRANWRAFIINNSFTLLFNLILFVNYIKIKCNVTMLYINTAINPADALSREHVL